MKFIGAPAGIEGAAAQGSFFREKAPQKSFWKKFFVTLWDGRLFFWHFSLGICSSSCLFAERGKRCRHMPPAAAMSCNRQMPLGQAQKKKPKEKPEAIASGFLLGS